MALRHRLARHADVAALADLMERAIYTACGYRPLERFTDARGGTPVPLLRMRKDL